MEHFKHEEVEFAYVSETKEKVFLCNECFVYFVLDSLKIDEKNTGSN